MNSNIKAVVFIASAVTVAGLTTVHTLKTIQREELKRQEAVKNSHLDIQAINTAADVVKARIERGEIRSLEQLAKNLRTEIDFQKIAIREEI